MGKKEALLVSIESNIPFADNVDRQLRYFGTQILQEGIPTRPKHEYANILAAPSASEIDELADRCEHLEQRCVRRRLSDLVDRSGLQFLRVASLYDSYKTLKTREVELTEWRWTLTETGAFFDRVILSSVLA